jgi:hypothetical protein
MLGADPGLVGDRRSRPRMVAGDDDDLDTRMPGLQYRRHDFRTDRIDHRHDAEILEPGFTVFAGHGLCLEPPPSAGQDSHAEGCVEVGSVRVPL